MRVIDHIVLAVPNLNRACDEFIINYGISPIFGGKHEQFGTHNALVNLGEGNYLEILAPDPSNVTSIGKRWMGADLVNKSVVSRWALKSSNLESDQATLKAVNPSYGEIIEGQRQKMTGELLQWKMIKPLAEPLTDVLPFMVDWSGTETHPTDSLPEECKFLSIEVKHPEVDQIQSVFNQLDLSTSVEYAAEASLKIRLQTDMGIFEL